MKQEATTANKEKEIESLLNNFIEIDLPFPDIIEPHNGFQIYVYLEESYNGDFIYNQEGVYFLPTILRNYTGLKPIKKVILSNVSYKAPGIIPLYKGNPINTNDVYTFEEKSLCLNNDFMGLEISKIDQFFDLEVDSNTYRGEDNLFSMTLQVEDFLGNMSNKVLLNFICYDGII